MDARAEGTETGTQADAASAVLIDNAGRLLTIAQRLPVVMADIARRQARSGAFAIPDPLIVAEVFTRFGIGMLRDPAAVVGAQMGLIREFAEMAQDMMWRHLGQGSAPVGTPAKDDKRFADDSWTKEPLFDFLKQSYLLMARWTERTVRRTGDLDPATRRKVEFYTRQIVDALSPTNHPLTNPRVLRAITESKGENLIAGLENWLEDMQEGRIALTDRRAFRVGENLAITPGKVIAQNDLIQLLQYTPTTETVHQRPLLIVPPWINKYYILDLRPRNSFIKWAVDQGFTVFCISWVNPDAALANKTFDDYLREGPLAALDFIRQATGEAEVNILGYCIGGTLTACALAYLAAKGDPRPQSATFLTTMVDFAEPGELGVFIDETQIDLIERQMQRKGFLEGRHMARVFNMMRDNDLIWTFAIHNYLLGRQPMPFDMLHWNSDSTRMPAMMHGFYLRKMYLQNLLVKPNAVTLLGTGIDLRRIAIPTYILSTREDHIAPWTSTYAATQHYQGEKTFVLAASGHIAGAMNPPSGNKYGYWLNPNLPPAPEAWLADATPHPGSWWPHWREWLAGRSGPQIPARHPGEGELQPIEDAPGSYVKMRSEE